ncbi:MAG: PAS domain S-box protein [Alphaproteobacteria bacterium]|nr:PAS domain S-box protein [Alphaproteobacteria bacterium]
MSIQPRPGSPAIRRIAISRGAFVLLAVGAVLSAGVIVASLLQQRVDALAAGEKLGSAFVQLADEQTSRSLQIAEQTLQLAEVRLSAAIAAGRGSEAAMRTDFRELIAAHPFLRAIWVADERGRLVYDSDVGSIGVDLTERPYFKHHRDRPESGFMIGAPTRSRTNGTWFIPVSQTLRRPGGEFAGVIVGALEPRFFDRIWRLGCAQDCMISLFRDDRVLMMRSPLEERLLATILPPGPITPLLKAGQVSGNFELASPIDGEKRLVAWRRLDAYPSFFIIVAQPTAGVLADWWRAVWISVVGWTVVVAALAGLIVLLSREWRVRHAADERSRLLFEASPYPIYAIDRQTQRFTAANDAAVAQYGWSREEFLSMGVDDLYRPEDVPAVHAARQKILPGLLQQGISGATRVLEGLQQRTKSGDIIDVELNLRLIELDGRLTTLVMARNVTDRVRAERARQAAETQALESQERYRLLFESVPYPVVVTDRRTMRLLAVNDATTRLYGWSREELLAMVIEDFYRPEDRAASISRRQGFSADVTQIVRGVRHLRKDGTLIDIELAVRFLEYDGRAAALAIVVDVTDRLRADLAHKAAEEQLRQSQKMEAVGQLTGGIAHDFNNILTVILANIDALQEEENVDPPVAARLERVSKAVQRASDLTRQLLAYSRKQSLRPQRTNINDLVTTTGNLLRRSLGAQIEIDQSLANDLWPVNVDRTQLETALVNLCVNARDAMPDGGRLSIETANVTLDAAYVTRNPDATIGDHVMLAVTDTGSGMAPDVAARVFEPFFTTKGVGKGTGLGLSMVYGFIKQSKGHIAVDSAVGRGTTFRLHLPRGKDGQMEKAGEQKIEVVGGKERILVAEDEPNVRAGAVLQLKSLGYTVSEASDGAAGVAAFEAASQPFDLLLTDVVMPGRLNGKALADEVARRWPATRIVFMSGYSDNALTEDGRLSAGVLLLSKPFRKADLATIVRKALG